jgi:hypothetical protein
MFDNVTDFLAYKAQATSATRDDNKPFDIDASLAKLGLDRAAIDATFAHFVTNENKQAPGVARKQKVLKGHREFLAILQKMVAEAQAQVAAAIEVERGLEDQVMIEKCLWLHRSGRGSPGDGTKQPKRKRNSRRS